MIEITGDVFKKLHLFDALCITTNGFVKKNGEAVMGRGCAKKANEKWSKHMLALILGTRIIGGGNVVHKLWRGPANCWIVSFPVKPINHIMLEGQLVQDLVVRHMVHKFDSRPGIVIPGWAMKADINLIERSARQLVHMTTENEWENVVVPRPGCGAGELNWKDVKPRLESILDDRFQVITFS